MKRIFLVEDNALILEATAAYLRQNGFEVTEFMRCAGVLESAIRNPPDLLVLDVMLPDGDGFSLARRIRKAQPIPLMFLTARGEEPDRIRGLEQGADDYLVKPFSVRELVLRVQAILRRSEPEKNAEQCQPEVELWSCDGKTILFDGENRRVSLGGAELRMTNAETRILFYLVAHAGKLCSRDAILSKALDYNFCGQTRTIDTHVKTIRLKRGPVFHRSAGVQELRFYVDRTRAEIFADVIQAD